MNVGLAMHQNCNSGEYWLANENISFVGNIRPDTEYLYAESVTELSPLKSKYFLSRRNIVCH